MSRTSRIGSVHAWAGGGRAVVELRYMGDRTVTFDSDKPSFTLLSVAIERAEREAREHRPSLPGVSSTRAPSTPAAPPPAVVRVEPVVRQPEPPPAPEHDHVAELAPSLTDARVAAWVTWASRILRGVRPSTL
ncbi:MAG: hypothetical protein HY908_02110 [Myxococcales bacterium]|nr:hypothetical protein [Myxococcales bacterium]